MNALTSIFCLAAIGLLGIYHFTADELCWVAGAVLIVVAIILGVLCEKKKG